MNKEKKQGRPFKYETAEELNAIVDKYFNELEEGDMPTMYGLANRLDVQRQTLFDWETSTERTHLSDAIKKAKQRIYEAVEHKLLTTKTSPVGAIFWLKNSTRGEWKDASEVTSNVNVSLGVIQVPPKLTQAQVDAEANKGTITIDAIKKDETKGLKD